MREITGLQRDLLVVIGSLDEPSGLEIKQELEHSQERQLLASRIYDNLDDLVSDDLLEKGRSDGRTNAYSLTTRGVEAIRDRYRWRESYLPTADVLVDDHEPRTDDSRRSMAWHVS